jgi:hypothetical protein
MRTDRLRLHIEMLAQNGALWGFGSVPIVTGGLVPEAHGCVLLSRN